MSGTPYNLTTGRDDNGDAIFNDRPAGASAQQPARRVDDADRLAGVVDGPSQRPNGSINFQRGPAAAGEAAARAAPAGPAAVPGDSNQGSGASRCTCS